MGSTHDQPHDNTSTAGASVKKQGHSGEGTDTVLKTRPELTSYTRAAVGGGAAGAIKSCGRARVGCSTGALHRGRTAETLSIPHGRVGDGATHYRAAADSSRSIRREDRSTLPALQGVQEQKKTMEKHDRQQASRGSCLMQANWQGNFPFYCRPKAGHTEPARWRDVPDQNYQKASDAKWGRGAQGYSREHHQARVPRSHPMCSRHHKEPSSRGRAAAGKGSATAATE